MNWHYEENWDVNLAQETGLFVGLFDYTLKLRNCVAAMSKNATYTSPKIQNEIIADVAELTRKRIVAEVNVSDYFTVFADGTKDKNNDEIISIAVRYVKNEDPHETLLGFVKCTDKFAEPTANLILKEPTS